ncbi:MAG: hypothetical protein RLZZ292_3874, partial [Bacteroidota bacterium]
MSIIISNQPLKRFLFLLNCFFLFILPPLSINAQNLTISGDNGICPSGGAARLTATAGFRSYAWSTGDTARSILVSAVGSYTVNAIDT